MHMTRPILKAAAALGLGLAAAAASAAPGDHFILNWDLDGDGIVTLTELETRRGDVFYSFDADGNDQLDAEEYVFFDEARANDMANEPGHGQGGGMQAADEGMTLAFNDSDGDGAVSRAEFVAKAAEWLVLMDRDASGDITSADFGRR